MNLIYVSCFCLVSVVKETIITSFFFNTLNYFCRVKFSPNGNGRIVFYKYSLILEIIPAYSASDRYTLPGFIWNVPP